MAGLMREVRMRLEAGRVPRFALGPAAAICMYSGLQVNVYIEVSLY